ncbi:outer membrane autotransporter barrel domain-containing protein [Azorhizobium oxalatiphilum]|uniref:Outer membrane autotransporter barrel domain-containing protein n=2 Tax=Azorhizobium oxalatiphilum TaxID=980631 RepID=A0A917FJT7_9HYPH|nr:outer membrane autotransporter barrel domain-containing protein [Azorhizobium oxalatiphilum]
MSSTALVGVALGAAPSMAQTVAGASAALPAPGESITLTGADIDPDAAVFAGSGAPAGTFIFNGTSSLRGDIYVNGASVRAVTEGGFGSGTIHMIDPTAVYGITGIYSNDIDLAAIDTRNDPATLRAEAGVTATLTGSITESLAGQNLVFEGVDGSGFVLTNGANLWTGITTIRSGTLTGTTASIGGSTLNLDDGSLVLDQAASGTFAQNISGTGNVTVRGLAAGQMLTFSGTSDIEGRIEVTDASHIAISGAFSSSVTTGILLSGAGSSLDVMAGGSIGTTVLGTADHQTITNFGTITARDNQSAVTTTGSDAVIVNGAGGTIIGGGKEAGTGVSLTGGGSITNSGTISAQGYIAIYLNGESAVLTNNSGGIIGGENSPPSVVGDAANITINNAGTMFGVFLRGGGAATITNSGIIDVNATLFGVSVEGVGTLINSGQIFAGQSVQFLGAGSGVVNQKEGEIFSYSPIAITINGSVDNSGYIGSNGDRRNGSIVFNGASGSLINNVDGVIENVINGLSITSFTNEFRLVNYGNIIGAVVMLGDAESPRNITIINTGSIAETENKNDPYILSASANEISFDNSGSITAASIGGVNFDGNLTAINRASGIVSSNFDTVSMSNGSFVNQGTIRSLSSSAVVISGGAFTNSGVVDGGGRAGVEMYQGSLTNQAGGTIIGSETSVDLRSSTSATANLEAGSTTTGDIRARGTGTFHVTIAGTLNGSYLGRDLDEDDGVDVLTVATSAAISGILDGGGNEDSLILVGEGAATLGMVAHFENATLNGTGSWTLGAANDVASWTVNAGTLISGGEIAGSASVVLAAGGTLQLSGDQSVARIRGTGTIALADHSLSLLEGTSVFDGSVNGTGTLVIDGANLVFGGIASHTGSTEVRSGTLSGGGRITGDVFIENGAHLAGTQGTTLSMGALDLSAGAQIDVTLGTPSDAALFDIAGNLTLDGTLNITATLGFGAGVYRLFNYGGTLTDNGLTIGTTTGAAAADLLIQTQVPGAVNLINGAGAALVFWDGGDASGHFNDVVDGGSGRWSVGGENWTDAGGALNGPMLPAPGYAVFQGTSGTVTVDTGAGAVSTTGMQFAVDGYTLAGDALTLVGDRAILRVGDGTAAGAGYQATISASLIGTSGVEKTDYGTLILTGANTYTGGTTISGGTLQLGDGLTNGSILGDVVNNGTLAFDLAGDTSFAGTISGAGALTLQGWGTLSLTGANSYAGGTAVNNGTLQIAQAEALGAGGLTLSDNATLRASGTFTYGGAVTLVTRERFTRAEGPVSATVEVDPSQTLTLSGVISGEGALTKTGEGLLILTGNNTYTGLTTIDAGTLQIGNGGTKGSIVGDVVNNATLVFNRSDTYTFTGAITGDGAVTFMGGGTVLFSSPYTGAVTVEQSVVTLVEGSSTTSPFTVNSGGTIGGSATIGGLTVNAGGTAAPGYSPGTITVTGPVTFNSGSVYLVDVTPTGAHDLIIASGAVTLSSGASVAVNPTAGRYAASSTVTILTTSSTLTGTFGSVSSNYAFLSPELSYDAQNVYLTLVYSGTDFSTYARTPNQYRTAEAAQVLGAGNIVFDTIVGLPEADVAPAFDKLSGEIYASVGTVIQQEAGYLREAVGTRLRQSVTASGTGALSYAARAAGPATAQLSRDLTPTLWMQGYGGWGNAFGNGNAASISSSVGGVFGGLDVGVADGVRAGLVAGFSQTHFDVDGRGSSGSMDNYDIGFYAGGQFGALALRGGVSYTWHDVSVSRSVLFPGFGGFTKGGDTVGTTQVFGEVGYGVDVGAYAFEPFVGLAYVNLSSGSLSENGPMMSGAELNVSTGSMDTVYSTLGLRVTTSMTLGGHTLTPSASIGWQHAFGDTSPVANMVFQNGALPFQVSGVPVAEDALLVGAGLAYDLSDIATLQVNYTGQLAGTAAQNAVSAQFSLKF